MKTIITVTAVDNHWEDGKLTFTDHEALSSGRTLWIDQTMVSVGPDLSAPVGTRERDGGIVLQRTPKDHERAHDHPWIDNRGRVWSSYTVDVDIQR
jgi:hypothetical protein